jgi:hypothetical protein
LICVLEAGCQPAPGGHGGPPLRQPFGAGLGSLLALTVIFATCVPGKRRYTEHIGVTEDKAHWKKEEILLSDSVTCRQFHHDIQRHFDDLFDRYSFELIHREEEVDAPFCLLVFQSSDCRLRFILDRGIPELSIGPRAAPVTRRKREEDLEAEWYDLSTLIDFLTQRAIRAPFLERNSRDSRSLSLDEHLEHISDRLRPHCDAILQFMRRDTFEQRREEFADFLKKREQEVLRQIREAYPDQLGERNSSP